MHSPTRHLLAWALGAFTASAECAADPMASWQVAWRRACRRAYNQEQSGVTEHQVSWCDGRFDTRDGRYLGRPPETASSDASDAGARTPNPVEVPRGYRLVQVCDGDSALLRHRRLFEIRVRGQTHAALTFRRGVVPTDCARSEDGARLAVATAAGVTVHVRRGAGYVATDRWTERGVGVLSFVDHGDTLLGWRSDDTLLTAWRVGAPAVVRGLPTSELPRSYACEPHHHTIEWMPFLTAEDVPPMAPRAEHALVGSCDGADVYATDAAEFADDRADDRRWGRAVAERYSIGGATPALRVWRAPWGDRMAAWSIRRPYVSANFMFDVRVVEHDGTLYRVEMERLHDGTDDPSSDPRATYEVALDRGRLDALLRAMFDPQGVRHHVAR